MTVRSRILLACLAVAVIPLLLFALGARYEVQRRLGSQFDERVASATGVIREDLNNISVTLERRLGNLAQRVDTDPRLRAALVQQVDRASVVEFAVTTMAAAQLDYLLLLDSAGTVLSSGHFRNEYGRQLPALSHLLAANSAVLLAGRRANEPLLALVRARPFTLSGQRFLLVGGNTFDEAFVRSLARDTTGTIVVTLTYPGGTLRSHEDADRISYEGSKQRMALPFVDDASGTTTATDTAYWTVAHSSLPLQRVQRALDRWLLGATVGALLLAVISARILAARVNRPLEELARASTRVDLERGDVHLATRRSDEIGTLARMLDNMVQRLRSGAQQLRAAERRATVGDLARQVNHDIRNGLLPIRNVIHHLTEVSTTAPGELNQVFAEREHTLHSGLSYLEQLATNYARLSPRVERQHCDLNETVRAVVTHALAGDARVRLALTDAAPRVEADPVALRRVIENLAVNAIESLPAGEGSITLSTSMISAAPDSRVVTLSVADTGSGIDASAREHIFDDFYTTRERGTGLGLSIVRRLVADMGGRIHVDSEPGQGTTFRVELPEAS